MPGHRDRIRDFQTQSGQKPTGVTPARGNIISDIGSDLKLALGFTVITLAFIFVPYAPFAVRSSRWRVHSSQTGADFYSHHKRASR